MLKILNNPKTKSYLLLKEKILGDDFAWYYNSSSTNSYLIKDKGHENVPFYSHILLSRPDGKDGNPYSVVNSNKFPFAEKVISEIILSNQDPFDTGNKRFVYMRMGINSSFPIEGNQFSIRHKDHCFPHFNFICYLTEEHGGGGRTFIEGHSPVIPIEDQCIMFTGKHYMELPRKGRRVIIVGTLINFSGDVTS